MGEIIIVLVIYVCNIYIYMYIVLYYPMSPIGRRLGHAPGPGLSQPALWRTSLIR